MKSGKTFGNDSIKNMLGKIRWMPTLEGSRRPLQSSFSWEEHTQQPEEGRQIGSITRKGNKI